MDRPAVRSSTHHPSARTGGIAGIVFALGLLILGFTVYFTQPVFTDSVADVREYFADNETLRPIADWIGAILFVFGFLLFASALRSELRSDDEDGTWSRTSFAGAVITVAVAGVGGVFTSVFYLGALDDLSDGAITTFLTMDAFVYAALLPFGFALFLTGASVVMLRGSRFPAWLGWLGFVTAAAMVIGALWPIDGDPEGALAIVVAIGQMAMLLWVIVTGALMTRSTN